MGFRGSFAGSEPPFGRFVAGETTFFRGPGSVGPGWGLGGVGLGGGALAEDLVFHSLDLVDDAVAHDLLFRKLLIPHEFELEAALLMLA